MSLVYNMILILLCTVYAVKTRNIPGTEDFFVDIFKKSKTTFRIVYAIDQSGKQLSEVLSMEIN
jgi:hypothetical protein